MKRLNVLIPLYLVMLCVIFILPISSVNEYNIIHNTTSQLGAQHTKNAWVMNVTFLGLGSIYEGLTKIKNFYYFKIIIFLFGVSLIFTGIFKHAPINTDINYNIKEDEYHSLFASLTGWSFTIFAFSSIFIDLGVKRKIIALSVAMFVTIMSLLMVFIPTYMGIWQRLIFAVSFIWLVYFLNGFSNIQS